MTDIFNGECPQLNAPDRRIIFIPARIKQLSRPEPIRARASICVLNTCPVQKDTTILTMPCTRQNRNTAKTTLRYTFFIFVYLFFIIHHFNSFYFLALHQHMAFIRQRGGEEIHITPLFKFEAFAKLVYRGREIAHSKIGFPNLQLQRFQTLL